MIFELFKHSLDVSCREIHFIICIPYTYTIHVTTKPDFSRSSCILRNCNPYNPLAPSQIFSLTLLHPLYFSQTWATCWRRASAVRWLATSSSPSGCTWRYARWPTSFPRRRWPSSTPRSSSPRGRRPLDEATSAANWVRGLYYILADTVFANWL